MSLTHPRDYTRDPRDLRDLVVNSLQSALIDSISICDALRDLVPFAQFKKREKHPWRNN